MHTHADFSCNQQEFIWWVFPHFTIHLEAPALASIHDASAANPALKSSDLRCCSVLVSHVWLFVTWTAACQAPGVCSGSCPLSWWWYLIIPSSVAPFSFCLQSFPASGSLPMSWLFASGGQSIGASASAMVLPVHIQDWFPWGFTALISLQPKGFSRVFSSTMIRKYKFFGYLTPFSTFTPVTE